MYKVEFCDVPFGTFENLEDAVALALAVHRSSNVPHSVTVINGLHVRTELSLKLDAVDNG